MSKSPILPLILLFLYTVSSTEIFYTREGIIDTGAISFNTLNPYQCPCDLTQGACDDRCCCDNDCTNAAIKTQWRSSGLCILNLRAKSFCSLEDNVFQIVDVGNRRSIQATFFQNTTDKGVCIEVTPESSDFVNSALIVSSQLSAAKVNEYITRTRQEYTYSNPQTLDRNYQVGYNLVLSDNTLLTIPTPDGFGNCENIYKVRYGINENKRSCRMVVNSQTCAAGKLSAQTALSKVFLRGPRSTTTVAMTLNEVNIINANTQVQTTVVNTNNNVSIATYAPSSATVSGTLCRCSNVLVGLEYIITIEPNRITTVNFIPTVTNVDYTCTGSAYVSQSSAVTFIGSDTQLPIAQRTAGNPGYRFGSPLRIGTRTSVTNSGSTLQAVQISKVYFEVNGIDVNGNCLYQSDGASSTLGKNILFGQDSTYSCQLNVTTLATFCDSASTANNWPKIALWNNFVPQASGTYIGKFGNANVNYIQDFVNLQGTTAASAPLTYDATSATCTLFSKSTVNIYYSSVGYYEDYQYYVADARATFDGQMQVSSTDSLSSLTFQLAVKFIDIDKINSDYKSGERPSFIPQLPRDILYPLFFPSEESAFYISTNLALFLVIFAVAMGF